MRRYQYLGYWIEVFIEPLPDKLYSSYEEAEFAAEELINSWN